MQKRYKFEGDIPKNLCTLQKISNLKPIKNPFKLLKLNLTQKVILDLGKIVAMEIHHIPQLEVVPNNHVIPADTMIADYNPSRIVCPPDTEANEEASLPGRGLPVVHPEHLQSMVVIYQGKVSVMKK